MSGQTQPRSVAVAVVSWNTRELLRECLESLRGDADRGLAEVWVVDNASSDGSADLVRQQFPWVKLVASSENLGFGAAVNAVAARTSTPWIVPANADVRVDREALARLVAHGAAHPEAAVVAPRLILPGGRTQHSVYPFPTLPFTLAYAFGAVAHSKRLARYWGIDGGFDADRDREVAWAVGAFLLVRRAAWNAVGGFDESQWMYAEDLDLGWRLRRAGWTARYLPDARVWHAESAATTKAWGDARHARWHASTYAWIARRRGFPVARLTAAINIAGFAARGALDAARAHMVGLRRRELLERTR